MILQPLVNTGDPISQPNGQALPDTAKISFMLVDPDTLQPISLFDSITGEYINSGPVSAPLFSGEFWQSVEGEVKTPIGLWPNSRGEIPSAYLVSVSGSISKPFLIRVIEAAGNLTLVQARAAMGTLTLQQSSLIAAMMTAFAASENNAAISAGIAVDKALEATQALEAIDTTIAKTPFRLYTTYGITPMIYGAFLGDGVTPDVATQARIDALVALGIPTQHIYILVIPAGQLAVMDLLIGSVISTVSLTGLLDVASQLINSSLSDVVLSAPFYFVDLFNDASLDPTNFGVASAGTGTVTETTSLFLDSGVSPYSAGAAICYYKPFNIADNYTYTVVFDALDLTSIGDIWALYQHVGDPVTGTVAALGPSQRLRLELVNASLYFVIAPPGHAEYVSATITIAANTSYKAKFIVSGLTVRLQLLSMADAVLLDTGILTRGTTFEDTGTPYHLFMGDILTSHHNVRARIYKFEVAPT